ncbi:MAG: hypothetical protein NT027_01170 [Proteobacteria bacterium]|nr:hypothetical protein [Pseudomonadota bacterium]
MLLQKINDVSRLSAALIIFGTIQSCMPKRVTGLSEPSKNSKMASVNMPIPDSLKSNVQSGAIDGLTLEVIGGTCTDNSSGTNIPKSLRKIGSNGKVADEKLKKNCDYTIVLSLGKASANGMSLEKIYLTNDMDGIRTQVSRDKTSVDSISIVVRLAMTEEGKKILNLGNGSIDIPSKPNSESDADIKIDIAKPGSQSTPPSAITNYDWKKDVTFSDVPTFDFSGADFGSVFYKDIMQHTPSNERFSMISARSTEAHESLHGLNNAMRNRTKQDDGFFYFENGKGVYVPQPKKVMAKVKDYVGPNFKAIASSRYSLYLITQVKDWPEVLYLFDEWSAYIGTARSSIEMANAGQWDKGNADPIDGLADFLYFCSASIVALKDHDPQSLETNKQLKAAFAMLAEQSAHYIKVASKMTTHWPTSDGEKRFQMLQSDAENEKIRSMLKTYMGADWTKTHLGF